MEPIIEPGVEVTGNLAGVVHYGCLQNDQVIRFYGKLIEVNRTIQMLLKSISRTLQIPMKELTMKEAEPHIRAIMELGWNTLPPNELIYRLSLVDTKSEYSVAYQYKEIDTKLN